MPSHPLALLVLALAGRDDLRGDVRDAGGQDQADHDAQLPGVDDSGDVEAVLEVELGCGLVDGVCVTVVPDPEGRRQLHDAVERVDDDEVPLEPDATVPIIRLDEHERDLSARHCPQNGAEFVLLGRQEGRSEAEEAGD